jgi:hypothetical protein
MALGSTQPLTEMSTRNLPGVKGRPAPEADNLTAIWADCLENVGAWASHNPLGVELVVYSPYSPKHSAVGVPGEGTIFFSVLCPASSNTDSNHGIANSVEMLICFNHSVP